MVVGSDGLAWNRFRYSLYAPLYNLIRPLFSSGRRESINQVQIQPGEKVLLLGCGTGLDLEFLPQGCEITAVDLTPAMVERTAAQAKALGLEIRAEVMNAQSLNLKPDTFDVVVAHLILAVVPEPGLAAQEMARVLRPSGRAVVFDKFLPDTQEPNVFRSLADKVTSVVFSNINRKLGEIIQDSGLVLFQQEASIMGGAFTISIVKPQ